MAWYENSEGQPQNDLLEEIPENAFTKPFPSSLWRIDPNVNDGLPYHEILEEIPENAFTQPFPSSLWRVDPSFNDGLPYHEILEDVYDLGAFANATNLKKVSIPKTVKKIGRYAFKNTKLTRVTIAKDCEYYSTSFPDGCIINFYE
jgi:hypothetical protein